MRIKVNAWTIYGISFNWHKTMEINLGKILTNWQLAHSSLNKPACLFVHCSNWSASDSLTNFDYPFQSIHFPCSYYYYFIALHNFFELVSGLPYPSHCQPHQHIMLYVVHIGVSVRNWWPIICPLISLFDKHILYYCSFPLTTLHYYYSSHDEWIHAYNIQDWVKLYP